LTGTNLKGADLTSLNLSGVDKRKDTNINQAIFDGAIMCRKIIPDQKKQLIL
jgi:uncharacterized protein YjbI with pentapeptide repeats